jgi:L-alanine-DL-glutamate epimerase-like enolase superfamily enzyme
VKITGVETLCLSRPHAIEEQWVTARYRTIKADAAIVVIDTDEGLQGIGEACAYGVPTHIADTVAWLAPELVGQDPTDLSIVPHPNGHTRAWDCAVGGIDSALWDLRGKIAGKRVCDLITDNAPDRVRLYASSGCRYDWRINPHQLIDEVLSYIDEGYTATKIRIGTEWTWDGVTVDRFLGHMTDLSEAAAGRIEIMLDGNQRLTEDQSLIIAKHLDKLGFAWFEEPIPLADIDGYARLNAAVDMPITGGEMMTTVEQFRPYFERKAYDIVQPDVGVCGLSEALKIASIAERYGMLLRPHNWHNGLMTMANAHLVATFSSPGLLELCRIQGPLQWEMLANPPVIRDGYLEIPTTPGLGVELADNLTERFPYIEGHYAIQVDRPARAA